MKISKVAVIGAGSWGTALALVLSRNGYATVLWGHKSEHIEKLRGERQNRKYLEGHLFPDNLQVTSELGKAVENSDLVCMVVPSQGYRKVYREVVSFLPQSTAVVSAVKGIENKTLSTMTTIMEEETTLVPNTISFAVLSGPSFAREVVQGHPTAVTLGSRDLETARSLQKIFGNETFRVYASTDVIGLEVSAALKNVIAIATGICDGLGYGANTRAALITRGLAEITRMGIQLGADPSTFSGLSGMGDLILTCTGDLSRNRHVGLELGKGKKIATILEEMEMVAEGVKTTLSGYTLAQKQGVEMPILEQMYEILYQDMDCGEAVKNLLSRELKVE